VICKMVKLGEACYVRRGTTITKKQTIEGNVPVIGGGIKPTYFHNESNRMAGCITVSGSGASAGFVNSWDIPIFASDCSTVEPKDDTQLIKFIYYYLLSQQQFIYDNFRSGAAQPHVYAKDLETLDFPVIPLEQQQRIVAKLDAVFAEIDGAIEVANAKESEVEKLKTSLLSVSFSDDATRWKTVKLQGICHKITDGSHNPPKGVEYSEHLMLSSKNIHNDLISYDKPRFLSKSNFEDENKRTDIQLGDVLLTIVGTIGRCAVFEGSGSRFTLQRSVAVLKPKHDLVLPRFMMFVLQSMLGVLNDCARGVAQKGIYLKSLKALSFPLPPLEEQQCIVAKLDAIFSELADVNEAIKQCKTNYKALKSAILVQELQREVV